MPPEDGNEPSWTDPPRSPGSWQALETLRVIAYKIDRMEKEFSVLRGELREELHRMVADTKERVSDVEKRLIDPFRMRAIEAIVYGFVGIILVAVAYSLLSGHITSPTPPGLH